MLLALCGLSLSVSVCSSLRRLWTRRTTASLIFINSWTEKWSSSSSSSSSASSTSIWGQAPRTLTTRSSKGYFEKLTLWCIHGNDFWFRTVPLQGLFAVVWNVCPLSENSLGRPSCASFQSPEASSEKPCLNMSQTKPHGKPCWRCSLEAANTYVKTHRDMIKTAYTKYLHTQNLKLYSTKLQSLPCCLWTCFHCVNIIAKLFSNDQLTF